MDDHGLISIPNQMSRAAVRMVNRHFHAGELVRIGHGQYIGAADWENAFAEERLRLTALAQVHETNSGVITGAAALALHGSWVKTAGARIVVIGGSQDFGSARATIRRRAKIQPEHVTELQHRRVATIAKAAFDEACGRAPRKNRLADTRAAAMAIEGAIRHSVSRAAFAEIAAAYRRAHGRTFFLNILELCHGRCESPGEVLTKISLLEMGLRFHEQVEIYTPGGG